MRIDIRHPWLQTLPIFAFIVAIFFSLFLSLQGFSNPLTDFHNIRQTQTAIASYYFIQDGLRLDYQVPILGAPWSLPFEFPLFQAIVACVSGLFHTPLDQTGRGVSLFFFYLSTYIFIKIVKHLDIPKNYEYLFGVLFLLNPIHIFWSRTFMIESTVLFFSLLFLYCTLRLSQKINSPSLYLVGVAAGSIAGMMKITTFLLFVFPSLILILRKIVPEIISQRRKHHMLKKGLKYLLFLPYFCIPVLYCYFWLNYTEQVRSFNPLAGSSIVPMELDKWVFGSLDMRLSLETWKALFIQLSNLTGNNVLLILPFIGMIFFKKNRANTIIFYAPLFVAMILFTNLYLIHDYYLYEVTSFFIFGIGLFIASLSQRRWGVFLQILTILISISLFLFSYFTNYYPVQTRRDDSYTQIGKLIEENTNKNDVILYFGFDWDPQIPYYSKRRAIVNVYSRVLEDSFIRSSLIHTGKDSIGGMVMKEYDPSGVKERIEFFGFNPEPVFRNKLGELYIRKR